MGNKTSSPEHPRPPSPPPENSPLRKGALATPIDGRKMNKGSKEKEKDAVPDVVGGGKSKTKPSTEKKSQEAISDQSSNSLNKSTSKKKKKKKKKKLDPEAIRAKKIQQEKEWEKKAKLIEAARKVVRESRYPQKKPPEVSPQMSVSPLPTSSPASPLLTGPTTPVLQAEATWMDAPPPHIQPCPEAPPEEPQEEAVRTIEEKPCAMGMQNRSLYLMVGGNAPAHPVRRNESMMCLIPDDDLDRTQIAPTQLRPYSPVSAPSAAPSPSTPSLTSPPVPDRENSQFVLHILKRGWDELETEFFNESLPEKSRCSAFWKNLDKIRNKEIPCLDVTRVVLRQNPLGDFIHANFVETEKRRKRFICAQGPMENTLLDFWQMVIEEDVEAVVMLGDVSQQGNKNGSDYVPLSPRETANVGNVAVICEGSTKLDCAQSVIIRRLKIIRGENVRIVNHIHWEKCPDNGTPPVDNTAVTILKKIGSYRSPVVIHCSTGIGSTGSLVMLQLVKDHLETKGRTDGLGAILKNYRRQRWGSVETMEQWRWIYRTLVEMFLPQRMETNERVFKFREEYGERRAKELNLLIRNR